MKPVSVDSLALPSLEEVLVPLVMRAICPKPFPPEVLEFPEISLGLFPSLPPFALRVEGSGPLGYTFHPNRRKATALFRPFSHSIQRAFRAIVPGYILQDLSSWEDTNYVLPVLYWASTSPFVGTTADLLTYDVLNDSTLKRADATVSRHLPGLLRYLAPKLKDTNRSLAQMMKGSSRDVLTEMSQRRVRCVGLIKQESVIITTIVQSLFGFLAWEHSGRMSRAQVDSLERSVIRALDKTHVVRSRLARQFYIRQSIEPALPLVIMLAMKMLLERQAHPFEDGINRHGRVELPEMVEDGLPGWIL